MKRKKELMRILWLQKISIQRNTPNTKKSEEKLIQEILITTAHHSPQYKWILMQTMRHQRIYQLILEMYLSWIKWWIVCTEKTYWETIPLKLQYPEMQRVPQLGMTTESFMIWIIMWIMYDNKAPTREKNVLLETTSKSIESKIAVKISQEQEEQQHEYIPSQFL